ncbi:1-deoxy-D-xylulose 5-phosphate reductoisomerase [Gossypium arboreum]|uniref:1-deoxy-D-xylulose 5-phosphate reductoisomerase n=1 Tax=Gossypium arboreum TaxID=29729 RepID=A0A0B0NWS5_GOSAR|nr:1-deoxy-D-xylulose 5-phosphate reductoisomerase [Gossypium arboreum]
MNYVIVYEHDILNEFDEYVISSIAKLAQGSKDVRGSITVSTGHLGRRYVDITKAWINHVLEYLSD